VSRSFLSFSATGLYRHGQSSLQSYPQPLVAQDAYAGRSWLALALKAMQAKQAGLLG